MKWKTPCFVFLSYLPFFVKSMDVKKQHEPYIPDYSHYHNLTTIKSHILQIARRNPGIMKIDWSHVSTEGRPQILLRVTNFSRGVTYTPNDLKEVKNKISVLLSYGEHAREFLPVESMFYLLQNLTDGLHSPLNSPQELFTRTILSRFDLYIIVIANPDGRSIVEKTKNYCWRGTSTGVDLNRNFDWEFGKSGSSADPKDEEYHGGHVFSEIESRIYTSLISIRSFDAFLSFHSGIRQIYLPFADTLSKKSGREPKYIETMRQLAEQLSVATKHSFKYGKAYDLSPFTADGTVFDYMAGKTQVPISMAIELWGDEEHKGRSCFDQFNPPSQLLQRELSDLHPLYVTFFMFLIHRKNQPPMSDITKDAPSLTFGYVLLCIVIVLTCFVALHRKWCPWTKLLPRRRVVSLKSLSSTITVWGFKSSWA